MRVFSHMKSLNNVIILKKKWWCYVGWNVHKPLNPKFHVNQPQAEIIHHLIWQHPFNFCIHSHLILLFFQIPPELGQSAALVCHKQPIVLLPYWLNSSASYCNALEEFMQSVLRRFWCKPACWNRQSNHFLRVKWHR